MNSRYIFLFGGNPNLVSAGEAFALKSGGANAKIVLLLLNKEGWRDFLPAYVAPWKSVGATEYEVIMPERDGTIRYGHAEGFIKEATGIFIGGGDTLEYHKYYAQKPVSDLIIDKYNEGAVLGGCSAGALIMPEILVVSPIDSGFEKPYIDAGLGLLKELVIGVHFSNWNDLPNLVKGMVKTRISTAWGIDEDACLLFKDGEYNRIYGKSVFRIDMTDFTSEQYKITELG